jgi:predicted ATPase
LECHHELIRAALVAHGGQEVDTEGDALFATFGSARACVAAVVEMQRSIQASDWPGGEQVKVRMGVHSGEADQTAAGLVGYDVHRAARVAAVAHGGQVVLSESAAALVRDALPPGAALVDLGLHRLKDLGHPERISQLSINGLPSRFPALRSLDNPSLLNNLPALSSSFIGRQPELVEVRGAVASGRLVTLTGAGGAGMTRLALQVAAELLDGAGDGVWLVELASVNDGTQVPAAIGAALGITVSGEGALDGLIEALAHQSVLILLDNCEHLIAACASVADAVLRRCPKVHILATSREPLGISGEVVYRVPSLSLPDSSDGEPMGAIACDAVALFIDRARARGAVLAVAEHDTAVVVSICRRLDGMPLAIELAAARLSSMSLTEVHERLGQRFRLLTGGDRNALPRQQTLRATVQWSYSLLDEHERALLRRLSVFSDGFDLASAEAVCGFGQIDELGVADLVGSLVDKSLLVAESAGQLFRYRLLETIRQFAAEHLAEDPEEVVAAEEAHLEHFLAVAERAMPHLMRRDQGRWRACLDPDQANIRRALGYAAGQPDHTQAALLRGRAALLLAGWRPASRHARAARAGAAASGSRSVPRTVVGRAGHIRVSGG